MLSSGYADAANRQRAGSSAGKAVYPAFRAVRRGTIRAAARFSEWLKHSGCTLRDEFAQAGRLVREAWQRHPVMGILQALKLPVLAGRRHKKAIVRTLNVAMPAAAVLVLALTVHYWRHLTFALALEYDGQTLGYIRDESVYDDAAALAAGRVINEGNAFQVECAPRLTLAVVPFVRTDGFRTRCATRSCSPRAGKLNGRAGCILTIVLKVRSAAVPDWRRCSKV